MCERALGKNSGSLESVPDHLKTQQMCNSAVSEDPYYLQFVPDWFVTQGQVKIWHKSHDSDRDELIEWYEAYKKRKAQKAQIDKELLPITWYPSRW